MDSYVAEEKLKDFTPEPNWDKFKTLKHSPVGRASQPALVGISRTIVSFNHTIQKDNMLFRNVEIKTAGAQILFTFKKEADANTYRVLIGKSGAHIGSPRLSERLAELADLHTKLFRYKFKPFYYNPKQHRLVINLADSPYSKSKIKKG